MKVCTTTLEQRNAYLSRYGNVIQGNPDDIIEYLPSDSQWGIKGWSFSTLKMAEEKMIEILSKESGKPVDSSVE
jgi:hypothetical protein